MEAWTVGLVAVLVGGLALILFGALSDRRRNARAARDMLSVPQRSIPQFRPDAPSPQYLSELQARRPTAEATTTLAPAARTTLAAAIDDPTTTTIAVGYASRDFITDPATSWAVQTGAQVLVCTEPVTSMRELLPVLERSTVSRTPLVLAAPAIAPEVLATLEVNQIRGLVRLLVVVCPDADPLAAIARVTAAVPLGRADLQSGYLPPDQLGRVGVWVSDGKRSHLIDVDHGTAAANPDQARKHDY